MKTIFASLLILLSTAAVSSAQILQFDLIGLGGSGLLGSNETGSPTTPGSGGEIGSGIFLDTSTNVLSINVGWGTGNGFTDLTGIATNAHIHGPANISSNAGPVVQLGTSAVSGITFDNSATGGSIAGSFDLDDLSLTSTDLLAGNWYINVHTAINGGGEIRGNLAAVPEPAMFGTLAALFVLAGALVRRRR